MAVNGNNDPGVGYAADSHKLGEIDEALRAGNTPLAMDLAKAALEAAKASGAPDRVAVALIHLSHLHAFLQNHAEAHKALEAALGAIPGADDSPSHADVRCKCLGALGLSHIAARRYEKARQFIERGLAAAAAINGDDSRLQQSMLKAPLAWLMIQSGEAEAAIALVPGAISALTVIPELYQPIGQMLALLAHGRARLGIESLLEPSDIPSGLPLPVAMESIAVHVRRLATPEDGKGPLEKPEITLRMAQWLAGWLETVAGKRTRLTADCLMMLAEIEAGMGDFGAMAESLGRAARVYGERSEISLMLKAERARVGACARGGEMDGALGLSNALVERLRPHGDPAMLAEAVVENGHLRLALADEHGARAMFSEALTIIKDSPSAELESVARLALGVIAVRTGRKEEAFSQLTTVTTLIPESHDLHHIALENLKSLSAGPSGVPPAAGDSPVGNLTAMLKDTLPPDLAGKMESLMKLASSLPGASPRSGNSDIERSLAEFEARAMEGLHGVLGQLKGPLG